MNTTIDFLGETIAEYSGCQISELYRDPDKSIRAQQKARERIGSLFGHDIGNPRLFVPSFLTVEIYGGRISYTEDVDPGVAAPAVRDISKIKEYRVPDSYWEQPCIQFYVRMRTRFHQELGYTPSIIRDPNGPATAAKMLRGSDFFTDLILHPQQARQLLSLATDNLICYREEMSRRQGLEYRNCPGGSWDDVAGLISPQMYDSFIVPCYRRIIAYFQPTHLYFHSEELHREHLHYIRDLPIECLDWGWDNHLSIDIVRRETDFRFSWNFNYIRDIREGTPQSIRDLYRRRLDEGGERLLRMKACVPRGTPRDNVATLIEVSREYAGTQQ